MMMRKRWPVLFLICVLWIFSAVPASAAAEGVIAESDTAIAAVQAAGGWSSQLAETQLGDLLADAVRAGCGCDAAVVCGGHVLHSISYGQITESEVYAAVDGEAMPAAAQVTPAELAALLEAVLGDVVLGRDEKIDADASASFFYPQVSGITLRYDASAPAGDRIVSIECGGRRLDPGDTESTLTLALSEDYLLRADAPAGIPPMRAATAAQSEAQMLAAHLAALGRVEAPALDRVRVLGVSESLFERYSLIRILPYLALVILLVVLPRQKHRLRNMDGSLSKRYKKYNVLPTEDGGADVPRATRLR